jgi:multimeric flavodoxin WrbA
MSSLIRLLHFSASTATNRHDSHRAGLGIAGFLGEITKEYSLPLRTEFIWALPSVTNRDAVAALLTGMDVVVIGSPTYGQGSPWFIRRFFELCAAVALWGKLGTAWATSGGQHTGGELTVSDTLRSLQGLGGCTFSFAQKSMVFGTDQKFSGSGMFSLTDVWFMEQFARTIAAQAMLRIEPATDWAGRLGLNVYYYRSFPTQKEMTAKFGGWRDALNAPLLGNPDLAYQELTARLGFDARAPVAETLPFKDWLPVPDAPIP